MLAVGENERMTYVGLTDLDEDEDVAYIYEDTGMIIRCTHLISL